MLWVYANKLVGIGDNGDDDQVDFGHIDASSLGLFAKFLGFETFGQLKSCVCVRTGAPVALRQDVLLEGRKGRKKG